ncbi:MAG: hypothetical protein H6937_00990 [Burkholderiales bacterium]|nr:hypothetical protein [Burkholderiales bacterium]MDR4518282.1 hypothetical protein [Nitrosomonas sp.]
MKKLVLSVVFTLSLVLFGAQASFAENLVVKNGVVFIADGGLVVKDLNGVEVCTPESLVDLSSATDVVVQEDSAGYVAVVTIHPPIDPAVPEETMADFAVVDVTACFPEVVVDPVEEVVVDDCYAYLDGDTLNIPCILIGEDIISAVFTQNGGSQNWKAHGAFKNETVSGHHHERHGHDDGDNDR